MKSHWVNLGKMEYAAATTLQKQVVDAVITDKIGHTLLFVEHPPSLTLGASFHASNLIMSREFYASQGIEIYETERGGDITFHGPNQLVAYPIFKVSELGKDLHKWMRGLEEAVIVSLKALGIEGTRSPVNTGVWVNDKKVCAIGIKIKKWVSMHGVAINCNNDLKPFEWIIPCGIKTHGVTSLTEIKNQEITTTDLLPHIVNGFEQVFQIKLDSLPADVLLQKITQEAHAQTHA